VCGVRLRDPCSRVRNLGNSTFLTRVNDVNVLGLVKEMVLLLSQRNFHIPEDGILHSRRENLESYIALPGWAL
jgi:hypothetical protein